MIRWMVVQALTSFLEEIPKTACLVAKVTILLMAVLGRTRLMGGWELILSLEERKTIPSLEAPGLTRSMVVMAQIQLITLQVPQ